MKSGFPTQILVTAFAAFAIGQSSPLSAVVLPPVQQGGATETKSDQAISNQAPLLESGTPAALRESQQDPEEKLIRFQYNNMPWNRVIEDFTEETGLALQPFSEYPEGAFTLFEETDYTVMEGLDKLNFNLGLKGFALIRNGDQLFLVETQDISPSMVETINSTDLESRGLYEIMRCQYDLKGLDVSQIEDSVRALITNRRDLEELAYVPATQNLRVRGKGWQLRLVSGMVEKAMAAKGSKKDVFGSYEVKFLPPQQLLALAGPLFGLAADQREVRFSDEVLMRLSFDPLDNKIYVVSSQEHIDHVFDLFSKFDVDPNLEPLGPVSPKTLKTHFVNIDKDVAFQVMQTMMAGRDVRMEQDATTGDIVLLGSEQDHMDADVFLDELNKKGRGMKLIPLQHKSQATMIAMLQSMFGQTENLDGTVAGGGPKYIAVPDSDSLFVSGTPQEVANVEGMVLALDVPAKSVGGGTLVSPTRYLPMTERESDRLMGQIEEIYPVLSRTNKLNIVMPADRKLDRNEKMMRDKLDNMLEDPAVEQPLPSMPKPMDGSSTKPMDGSSSRSMDQSSDEVDLSRYQFVSTGPVQEQEVQVGQAAQGTDEATQSPVPGYVPPNQPDSIPGSPITISRVDGGLVIHSQDLSALDDVVDLLYQLRDEKSEADLPAIFYMKHRRPEYAKSLLDNLLGLSSGGGEGGGVGDLVGNVVGNALGPAGDLFGGLLGGGDLGDGSASSLVEGTITTFVDHKLNSLIVQGHTVNDYDLIVRLIEYIDQPEAPHKPDFVGKLYKIPIVYRDPELVREKVQNALVHAGLIDQGESVGGGNGGGGQEQILQQLLSGRGGRGGGGGGSNVNSAEEKPTITLDIDMEHRALLVTGPQFIYERVVEMVAVLDTKIDRGDTESIALSIDGVPPEMLAQFLKEVYDGPLTISSDTDDSTSSASSSQDSQETQNSSSRQQQQAAANQQQQILQAIQQQRARQQGGGGGRGVGGGRTGGGGGRGGRGGGGGGGRGGRG